MITTSAVRESERRTTTGRGDQSAARTEGSAPIPATVRNALIDRCLQELQANHVRYAETSIGQRIALAESCLAGILDQAEEWVEAACRAKGISAGSPFRAEEILAGPVTAARHLRLLIHTLTVLKAGDWQRLVSHTRIGHDGRVNVQVVPAPGTYDRTAFIDFHAETRMQSHVTLENLKDHIGGIYRSGHVHHVETVVVLGAGNVSSIPATDTFSKLFQEDKLVLLKMHPVNDYLEPIFTRALAPLIDAGFLRIVSGGADVGGYAIAHPAADSVHITGSVDSHDSIVWGPRGAERDRRQQDNDPLLTKPITSELGNVSPWVIVPGVYSKNQLKFQAENVAASLVNNAGFNCVTTRVLLTWKHWPQREQFIDLIQTVLRRTTNRSAYYPGAHERFVRYGGAPAEVVDQETLPWTLLPNIDPAQHADLFNSESFVCLCAETALEADSEQDFLAKSVDFLNNNVWGTLCAALTVPKSFRKNRQNAQHLDEALARLKYGNICINQWPGLAYGLICPPWGGYPDSTPDDVQSGSGWVHNTAMLDGVEKTVMEGPLTVFPKPIWFPTHKRPEPVAWELLRLYGYPSSGPLIKMIVQAVRGVFS